MNKIKLNIKLFIERNILLIGIILIIASIFLGVFNYKQIKIPLNTKYQNEIKIICNEIYGLGDNTYLLLSSKTYNKISEIKHEKNIGDDKYNLINQYFRNGDEFMLREFWYFCSLGLMMILFLLGGFVVIKSTIENTINNIATNDIMKDVIKRNKSN